MSETSGTAEFGPLEISSFELVSDFGFGPELTEVCIAPALKPPLSRLEGRRSGAEIAVATARESP
jgi:hypothetical protein